MRFKFKPEAVVGGLQTAITDVCADSRRIKSIGGAAAFLAYPGENDDGRKHISDAIANGAAAVLWEPQDYRWQIKHRITNAAVPNLREHIGDIADYVYGNPSREMYVAAVTGTNGKTTTAWFAAQLMRQKKAAVIGTLGAGMPKGKLAPTQNTTPDCAETHRLLRKFANEGAKAAVIEASSHGIAQKRLANVSLDCAALLNIGRDHLEYHGGENEYARVKWSLLQTPALKTAVINGDDELCRRAPQGEARALFFGADYGCDMQLINYKDEDGGAIAELKNGVCGRRNVSLPLPGAHNIGNFMAAVLIARSACVPCEELFDAAQDLSPPPGRMQRINKGEKPAVYIDYAHTPDALAAAMNALKQTRPLVVVCGCGGERDKSKRAQMGALAADADYVFITDDNPRREDAARIREEIAAGFNSRGNQCAMRIIADRAEAISSAVAVAKDGAVLIAGKGHEEYQEINGARVAFSDAETARAALTK